jgi:hypothetical protein
LLAGAIRSAGSRAGILDVPIALGIQHLQWYVSVGEYAPAAIARVIEVANAVAAGRCNTALVYRAMVRAQAQTQSVSARSARLPARTQPRDA